MTDIPIELSMGSTDGHTPVIIKIFGWNLYRIWRDELGQTIAITLEKDGMYRDYKWDH